MPPLPRSHPPPKVEEEIPISVLAIEEQEETIWISLNAISASEFPPCIKNIIRGAGGEKGMHRRGAILASFLGQCGWSEKEAGSLWRGAISAEERIYRKWFGNMNCPKCETMQRQSKGYPDLGIEDLELCQPDEKCQRIKSPVEYAADLFAEEELSRGRQEHIRTIFLARLFNWKTGREFDIDLTAEEKEDLESLKNKQMETDSANTILIFTWSKFRGRLRPKFRLMETDLPRRRMLSELL
jgi:hypothetical protein